MPIPADFQSGTVTAHYVDLLGQPVVGTVTFSMSPKRIIDAAFKTIIVPVSKVVTLDGTGSLSVDLPATDDPDVVPSGFTYQVVEAFNPSGGQSYSIPVPKNTVTDLSAVIAISPSNGGTIMAGPPGPAGPPGVGSLSLSDVNPTALGTAAPGTSTNASRGDHVHPTTGLIPTSQKGAASGVMDLGSDTLAPTGRLGAGTANNTTFLRGDKTWATPAGGGGGGDMLKSDNLSGLTNYPLARATLGLGTAAVTNTGIGATNTVLGNDSRLTDQRAPLNASVTIAKLTATGTPGSSTYLRGDNTWAAPAAATATVHGWGQGVNQTYTATYADYTSGGGVLTVTLPNPGGQVTIHALFTGLMTPSTNAVVLAQHRVGISLNGGSTFLFSVDMGARANDTLDAAQLIAQTLQETVTPTGTVVVKVQVRQPSGAPFAVASVGRLHVTMDPS